METTQTFSNLCYFVLATLLHFASLAYSNDDKYVKKKDLPIHISTGEATKANSSGKQLPAGQEISVFFAENPESDSSSGKTFDPNLK